MAWNERARRLSLRLAEGSREGSLLLPPLKRNLEVRLAGEKATRAITFEGRPIEVRF